MMNNPQPGELSDCLNPFGGTMKHFSSVVGVERHLESPS